MKKLLGAVVGAIALMASGLASAAPVDIVYNSSSSALNLRVDDGLSVGYVSLAFTGATSFTIGSGVNASPLAPNGDSVIDVAGGFFILASNPASAGGLLIPAGATTLLGTLVGATTLTEDPENLGSAVLDTSGATIASSITIVPEPSTLALLGLGLAGLALVRRTA